MVPHSGANDACANDYYENTHAGLAPLLLSVVHYYEMLRASLCLLFCWGVCADSAVQTAERDSILACLERQITSTLGLATSSCTNLQVG